MKSIWTMLKSAHGLLETDDLTTWEASFIRNCYDTVQHNRDTSRLSDKQVEIIETVFNKHFA